MQYFARLLGEPGEGQRALDLLGTRRVDAGLGAAFFGDPARLHRDLLGDAAKGALDELFRDRRP